MFERAAYEVVEYERAQVGICCCRSYDYEAVHSRRCGDRTTRVHDGSLVLLQVFKDTARSFHWT